MILIVLKMSFLCNCVIGFCTNVAGNLNSSRKYSRNHFRVATNQSSNISFPKLSLLGLLLETSQTAFTCWKRNSCLSQLFSCVNYYFYLKTSGTVQFSDPVNLLYAILLGQGRLINPRGQNFHYCLSLVAILQFLFFCCPNSWCIFRDKEIQGELLRRFSLQVVSNFFVDVPQSTGLLIYSEIPAHLFLNFSAANASPRAWAINLPCYSAGTSIGEIHYIC